MKRLLSADCFKSARRGVELSQLTIIQTIAMPLALVALDVYTDGTFLSDMNSHLASLISTNTTSYVNNSTDDNVTEQQNNSTSAETENWHALRGLSMASTIIISFSMLNLIFGNPFKTLIRNARSSALMASREMESKDVPLPIGEYIVKFV